MLECEVLVVKLSAVDALLAGAIALDRMSAEIGAFGARLLASVHIASEQKVHIP